LRAGRNAIRDRGPLARNCPRCTVGCALAGTTAACPGVRDVRAPVLCAVELPADAAGRTHASGPGRGRPAGRTGDRLQRHRQPRQHATALARRAALDAGRRGKRGNRRLRIAGAGVFAAPALAAGALPAVLCRRRPHPRCRDRRGGRHRGRPSTARDRHGAAHAGQLPGTGGGPGPVWQRGPGLGLDRRRNPHGIRGGRHDRVRGAAAARVRRRTQLSPTSQSLVYVAWAGIVPRMEKRYDREYFHRVYRHGDIGGRQRLARKVALAVATAEYHLERPLRSVLDVGCGEGAWRAPLLKLRPKLQYLGFDSSEYAITRYGRSRNLHFARFADFEQLCPCPPVDLLVCSDVLHYLPARELDRGLPGLAELCGGVAFLETFGREDQAEGDEHDFKQRPATFYRRRFEAAGFRQLGSHCWLSPAIAPAATALEAS